MKKKQCGGFNWACSFSQLIAMESEDEILVLLFHRSGYRWHGSLFIPPLICHFPLLLLLYFPAPFYSWSWASALFVRWQIWVFLPSAVVSSNFPPGLQKQNKQTKQKKKKRTVLFSKCFQFFMVRPLSSAEMAPSGLRIAPIFHRAIPLPSCVHQSLRSPPGAIFLPAAEWWPQWAWLSGWAEQGLAQGVDTR